MNFLVIGEKCKDIFVYGEVARLSPEAPVPIFKPLRSVENEGMAHNVYNNLFSLIEKKATVVGHFSSGEIKKTRLVDDKSNHYFIRIDENDRVDPIVINEYLIRIIKGADCILISDYDKGFLALPDIWKICQEKRKGAVVFLDSKKELTSGIIDSVDFVKFNEYESKRNFLQTEMYKEKIITTLGAKGARYNDQDFPGTKKITNDVSGAGDTFLAALAFYYMESRDIKLAIQKANQAASEVVSERGVSVI
jgi:D-beta-D-heptose 7-phosphate kinase/D-beta-D-heptose 1-phosphate adenosyltransferase